MYQDTSTLSTAHWSVWCIFYRKVVFKPRKYVCQHRERYHFHWEIMNIYFGRDGWWAEMWPDWPHVNKWPTRSLYNSRWFCRSSFQILVCIFFLKFFHDSCNINKGSFTSIWFFFFRFLCTIIDTFNDPIFITTVESTFLNRSEKQQSHNIYTASSISSRRNE